jgi:hypothetical protein
MRPRHPELGPPEDPLGLADFVNRFVDNPDFYIHQKHTHIDPEGCRHINVIFTPSFLQMMSWFTRKELNGILHICSQHVEHLRHHLHRAELEQIPANDARVRTMQDVCFAYEALRTAAESILEQPM